HPVRLVLVEYGVHRGQHRAGLDTVAAGPDAQVDVRVRDPQVGEEHVGHVLVVVLPGVHDHVLVPMLLLCGGERLRHRCQLHELRPRPDNAQDLHNYCVSPAIETVRSSAADWITASATTTV